MPKASNNDLIIIVVIEFLLCGILTLQFTLLKALLKSIIYKICNRFRIVLIDDIVQYLDINICRTLRQKYY